MKHKPTISPQNFQAQPEVFLQSQKIVYSKHRERQSALRKLNHSIGFNFTLDDATLDSIITVSKNLTR